MWLLVVSLRLALKLKDSNCKVITNKKVRKQILKGDGVFTYPCEDCSALLRAQLPNFDICRHIILEPLLKFILFNYKVEQKLSVVNY